MHWQGATPPPFLAHQDQEGWLPAGLTVVVAQGYLNLAALITKVAGTIPGPIRLFLTFCTDFFLLIGEKCTRKCYDPKFLTLTLDSKVIESDLIQRDTTLSPAAIQATC